MTSQTLARRLLGITSVLVPIDVLLAVISPYGPGHRITGPLASTINHLGFVSIFGAWITGIWHAAVARPWRPSMPRWLVLFLLALGTGIGSVLYYWITVLWQPNIPAPET